MGFSLQCEGDCGYLVYQLEVFFGGFRTLLGLGRIYHRPKFLEKNNNQSDNRKISVRHSKTVKETCQSVKEGQSRKHVESVKEKFIYSVKAKNERKTLTKTCLSQPKKHVSQSWKYSSWSVEQNSQSNTSLV
jgi:hypothetical protein